MLSEAGCTRAPFSCTSEKIDRENPPDPCGPDKIGVPKCKATTDVDGCPTDTACMASTKQSGDVLNFRMGRIKLWAPDALLSLSALALLLHIPFG